MFLVEPTFSDILKSVVKSKSVGNDDMLSASFVKRALNSIIIEMLMLNSINISSKNVGMGTIRKTIGTKIYSPRNKSCLFILRPLPFLFFHEKSLLAC